MVEEEKDNSSSLFEEGRRSLFQSMLARSSRTTLAATTLPSSEGVPLYWAETVVRLLFGTPLHCLVARRRRTIVLVMGLSLFYFVTLAVPPKTKKICIYYVSGLLKYSTAPVPEMPTHVPLDGNEARF